MPNDGRGVLWTVAFPAVIVVATVTAGCASSAAEREGRDRLLFSDDFRDGDLARRWVVERERGGSVVAGGGRMEIDVPGGCTVWFKHLIEGPVVIEYEANVVAAGGPNDRVSDLNCFWMARDARSPDDLFATRRSGKFEDYNQLRCYYVGLGGNGNTTTRFRRYIGDPEIRPLLPGHDLLGAGDLLTPNRWQTLQLVAAGGLIQFRRDGRVVFDMRDPEPYTSGWFGLRTVKNHMRVRNFRVYRYAGG